MTTLTAIDRTQTYNSGWCYVHISYTDERGGNREIPAIRFDSEPNADALVNFIKSQAAEIQALRAKVAL